MQSHVKRYRADYVDIATSAMHIPEQVSNQRTRVQSLIDSIDACQDSKICAWVASVTNEINGMSDDLEKSVARLLSACPVEGKTGTNGNNSHISGSDGDL